MVAYATVKYNFTARNESELTIRKGETLRVLEKHDDNWWTGEIDGREGLIPSNYVELLKEERVQHIKINSKNITPSIRKLQSSLGFRKDDEEIGVLYGKKEEGEEKRVKKKKEEEEKKKEEEEEEEEERQIDLTVEKCREGNGPLEKEENFVALSNQNKEQQQQGHSEHSSKRSSKEKKKKKKKKGKTKKESKSTKKTSTGEEEEEEDEENKEEKEEEEEKEKGNEVEEFDLKEEQGELPLSAHETKKRKPERKKNQHTEAATATQKSVSFKVEYLQENEQGRDTHKVKVHEIRLMQELETLRAEIHCITSERDSLQQQCKAKDEELGDLREKQNLLDNEIQQMRTIAMKKDVDINNLKKENDDNKEELNVAHMKLKHEEQKRKESEERQTQLMEEINSLNSKIAGWERQVNQIQNEKEHLQQKLLSEERNHNYEGNSVKLQEVELRNIKRKNEELQRTLGEQEAKYKNLKDQLEVSTKDHITQNLNLEESLHQTSFKLKKETTTRISLEKSVHQLEFELKDFKKRMLELLTLLEQRNSPSTKM